MKKMILMGVAMAAVCCAAAEPKTVKLDFAAQPEMFIARFPDNKKCDYVEKSIAIPEISDRNFTVANVEWCWDGWSTGSCGLSSLFKLCKKSE